MKIKISKLSIFLFSILVIFTIPLILADEYVTTQAYFYIPSDVSFTIRLPGPSVNPPYTAASGLPPPPYPATTWISFNATTGDDKWIQPQTEGVEFYKQNGALKPIFYVTNDGNTPIKIKLQIAVLDGCLNLCANSTCATVGGCGTATFYSTCTNIETEQELVTNLPYINGQNKANITLYADFTGCNVGLVGGTSYQITHHSTV